MLQREMDALNAKLAAEKAAHLATEEARKTAMAELAAQPATAVASSPLAAAALAAASLAAATEPAAKSAASAASPRTKQGEARTRLEQAAAQEQDPGAAGGARARGVVGILGVG